jgi:adenosylmethionine-8-amino-7-oxononanoate aminotransferase
MLLAPPLQEPYATAGGGEAEHLGSAFKRPDDCMTATSRILHRSLRDTPPLAVRGAGAFLYDEAGRAYLDASGGAAVSCLGHGHPRVIAALQRQAEQLAFAHTGFFSNAPAEALAEHLVARAPAGMGRVYFVSGGSEATETALKLARQVHLERGEEGRAHVIARLQSYHGNTLGALSVSGNLARRRPYAPMLLPHVSHIPPAYAYRHQEQGESLEDYGARMAEALEQEILRLGPETVCAFIAETVVGATLGAVPPPPGYFRAIRRICDRHGVLLILDEVMCGMGRTGTLFACEQEGVSPDMVTIAKGLGAGVQPIGAVVVRESLVRAIEDGSGVFQHGHTYIGHATACAAALETQRVIEEEDLLRRVREKGAQLRQRLVARFGGHPHLGDIRGRGFFIGLELVAARAAKTPFAREAGLANRIKQAAMEEGLICYPGNGTADGIDGDHVLLAPPYILSDGEMDMLVDKLDIALARALDRVKP